MGIPGCEKDGIGLAQDIELGTAEAHSSSLNNSRNGSTSVSFIRAGERPM